MSDFTSAHSTPVTSIRAFCIHCMGFQVSEVSKCNSSKCPLFPYRNGKRPQEGKKIGLKESLQIAKENGS